MGTTTTVIIRSVLLLRYPFLLLSIINSSSSMTIGIGITSIILAVNYPP